MSNDEGMTNLMNPTHSLSLPLLLKPNGAGTGERAGLKTNKMNDEARMSNDEGMTNLMNPTHSLFFRGAHAPSRVVFGALAEDHLQDFLL